MPKQQLQSVYDHIKCIQQRK